MNILVVDNHRLVIDGLKLLLYQLKPEVVVYDFTSGENTLIFFQQKSHPLDLVILDCDLHDIDGLTLFNLIRKQDKVTPIVFTSATENIRTIANAIHLGANGFISKLHSSRNMLLGLRMVLNGHVFINETLRPYVEQELISLRNTKKNINNLTKRQHEVLRVMSKGLSSKDIAAMLSITEATVKSHISVIFQTLNTSNRLECVRKAECLGLLNS